MEAMKEQMTIMMEAMKNMRKIMVVNVVAAVVASTTTEKDPTHPPIFNQEIHLVSNVEGQGGATRVTAYEPQYTQSHHRYTFHHMVCLLTIHHPLLYKCLPRTLLSQFVLRIIKLNLIRLEPITLIPGRRH